MKLENLKPSSRLWIYQSDRFLTEEECSKIEEAGKVFIENWTAHGSSLEAGIEVRDRCFILIAVDEQIANATGCSIDKSVHFVSDLGSKLGVDFFNRLNLVVQIDEQLEILSYSQIESKVDRGELQSSSLVYSNTLSILGDLNAKWKVPLSESWVARQLNFT